MADISLSGIAGEVDRISVSDEEDQSYSATQVLEKLERVDI